MDIKTYLEQFKAGKALQAPATGLCGRVIRGVKPDDFLTLTDDPSRRIVMLIDPDGLSALPGLSGYDVLITLGYEPDYLKYKVDEGNNFKLVVFGDGGEAKLATWDNLIAMVKLQYPEERDAFDSYISNLKCISFDKIQSQVGYKFLDVEKAGESDPRYMTYDRFRNSKKSLIEVRAFLYFTVHLREQYSGDGYTYDSQGNRGVMEYIIPNKPLSELGDYGITDVDVKLPNQTFNPKGPTMSNNYSYPSFYNPSNAASWSYDPNLRNLFEASSDYRKQGGIKMSATDRKKVALLVIDGQRDFCFPEGTLYVGGRSGTGAVDDSRRIAEFIYREIGQITTVIPTMDTHEAFQVFTPSFFLDQNGQHLQPHDIVDGNMEVIRAGKPTGLRASVNPAIVREVLGADNYLWLQKQITYYVAELARKGKYLLYIWPEHCVLGSLGHTLVGVIQEARMFHSYVRGSQNQAQIKGGNPLTENYSIFGPEVIERHDGQGNFAEKNKAFLNVLLSYDAVIIVGQAASHCVKSSIDDLLDDINQKDPSLAKKVYIPRDCTSSVVVPGVVDFTDVSEKAFDHYASAGMNIVLSTDPMSSWLKF